MRKNGLFFADIVLNLLLLPLLPLLLIPFLILWIFRQTVRLWLYLCLGDKFGGLIASEDKIYTPADKTKKLILSVNYIRTNQEIDIREKLKSVLEEKIFNSDNPYPKLTATRHCFLGQDYWINKQISIDDVIQTIPLPDNKEVQFNDDYIKAFAGHMGSSPLPKNDAALWDVHIATTPLVDLDVSGHVYPMLVRIHHVVADGARLVAFFGTVFTDGFNNYNDKLKFDSQQSNGILNNLKNLIQLLYLLYLTFISTGKGLTKTYFKSYKKNFIHGFPLSGEKLMAWAVESEIRHVPMIKRIKRRIPNTRFSDIIFTCISASFSNFFKKHNQKVPDKLSFIIPVLLSAPSVDISKPIELRNEFTVVFLDMPLLDSSHFLEGLEDMKASMDQIRKHFDKIVVYLLAKYICGVIPPSIIKLLYNSRPYAGLISVVPGVSRVKFLGEYDLLFNVTSAPHTHHTGITITIVTYDDKFQICLLVDKALISEQADVQFIADEILRNMEVLDKESLEFDD